MNTSRIELRLQAPAKVLQWVESLDETVRAELSPEWVERVRNLTEPNPWLCMFEIVRAADGVTVGTCGFKGPPDAAGMVEITYGIDEEYRGNGYATEAAATLLKLASTFPNIAVVRAHTKADNPASEAVLRKAGFAFVGEVVDAEDGEVRRWERGR